MQSGKLRHPLTIQQYAKSISDSGEVTRSWATFLETIGDIRSAKGGEYYEAEKQKSRISHNVKVRYATGVKAKMRILYGERVFNIVDVMADRTDARDQILRCIEEVVQST